MDESVVGEAVKVAGARPRRKGSTITVSKSPFIPVKPEDSALVCAPGYRALLKIIIWERASSNPELNISSRI